MSDDQSQRAHFQVNPQLARLLGETYRSSEVAIKELIDNAWDAEATQVWILLPAPMTDDPIIIRDNGVGMSGAQIRNEYLNIASDKRKRTGEKTVRLERKIKGRKGIGKFAGLTVANVMELHSVVQGEKYSLRVDKQDIITNEGDLENIPLELRVSTAQDDELGTSIVLTQLDQRLNFPSPDKLREVLVREYGREQNFEILIDGAPLTINDIPGHSSEQTQSLPNAGEAKICFTIHDGKNRPKSPGIILKIGGKVVGKPGFFGLEEDENIPRALVNRVYGEINLPDNEALVTADWGGVNESSRAYQEAQEFIHKSIREQLEKTHKKEMSLQKGRLRQAIDRKLSVLPENRRHFASKAMYRILMRYYGETDEKIETVADVALAAMEHDDYWTVLEAIKEASHGDIEEFAAALGEFGLLNLTHVGLQADRRKQFLDYLQELAEDNTTLEQMMHTALENNLWVLGHNRSLMASNISLKRIVELYCQKRYGDGNASKRPDLLLTEGIDGRHLLIEFKRPSLVIGRGEISQAEEYRDALYSYFDAASSFEIVLLGKQRDPNLSVDNLAHNISVHSYFDLISKARNEVEWLLKSLH